MTPSKVVVVADHVQFTGELLPRELWEALDCFYGFLDRIPDEPEEHLLLLGVTCRFHPGASQEQAFVFIRKSAVTSMSVADDTS